MYQKPKPWKSLPAGEDGATWGMEMEYTIYAYMHTWISIYLVYVCNLWLTKTVATDHSWSVSTQSSVAFFCFNPCRGYVYRGFLRNKTLSIPWMQICLVIIAEKGGVLKYEQSCFLMFPRWACCSEQIIQLESLEPSWDLSTYTHRYAIHCGAISFWNELYI